MYCQFKRLEHSFLVPRRVTFEHKTTITTALMRVCFSYQPQPNKFPLILMLRKLALTFKQSSLRTFIC